MKNIEQYKIIHTNFKRYGTTAVNHLDDIKLLISDIKADSVLDYGCGKGGLIGELEVGFKFNYDPAIDDYSNKPSTRFDVALNIDVLEHIERDEIFDVLYEIKRYSDNAIFIICLIKAGQMLPDGRNCHLTIEPPEWWLEEITKVFPNSEIYRLLKRKVIIKTWKSIDKFLV